MRNHYELALYDHDRGPTCNSVVNPDREPNLLKIITKCYLTCVHIIFSSAWVAEWPFLGK